MENVRSTRHVGLVPSNLSFAGSQSRLQPQTLWAKWMLKCDTTGGEISRVLNQSSISCVCCRVGTLAQISGDQRTPDARHWLRLLQTLPPRPLSPSRYASTRERDWLPCSVCVFCNVQGNGVKLPSPPSALDLRNDDEYYRPFSVGSAQTTAVFGLSGETR